MKLFLLFDMFTRFLWMLYRTEDDRSQKTILANQKENPTWRTRIHRLKMEILYHSPPPSPKKWKLPLRRHNFLTLVRASPIIILKFRRFLYKPRCSFVKLQAVYINFCCGTLVINYAQTTNEYRSMPRRRRRRTTTTTTTIVYVRNVVSPRPFNNI